MNNTPRTPSRLLVLLGLAALSATACNATYAPPLRSTHLRAPGRLAPNQGDLSATVGAAHGRGALGVSLPVSEVLSVEVQGDTSDTWHLGNASVRATHRSADRVLSLDGEVGGGAGVGGQRCGNAALDNSDPCPGLAVDGRGVTDRVAYGGFLGVGVGVRPVRWLSLFARTRAQLSAATNVPNTLWLSGLAGAEVYVGPVVFGLGAGYAHYRNSVENDGDAIVEGAVSVPFSLGASRARAALPPPAGE
jgi:hypothetical protein